jgi:hypothetical protein
MILETILLQGVALKSFKKPEDQGSLDASLDVVENTSQRLSSVLNKRPVKQLLMDIFDGFKMPSSIHAADVANMHYHA